MAATKTSPLTQKCDLPTLKQPVNQELIQTSTLIDLELASQIPLIQTMTKYLIHRGGKRLRPLTLLLCAKACNWQENPDALTLHGAYEPIALAAVIELIHSATLMHDDIVDDSTLRRGQETTNSRWGNSASVLAGDFLYSRSFQILAHFANVPITRELAYITNQIAEGEMLQLTCSHESSISIEEYYRVINLKTATLFAGGCKIGAIAAQAHDDHIQACECYGSNLGIAYQIIDDMLDYQSPAQSMGKNRFNDLEEGKMTLPLILLKQAAPADINQIVDAIIDGSEKASNHQIILYNALQQYNIFNACFDIATQFSQKAYKALDILDETPTTLGSLNSLKQLCNFILKRNH